LVLLQLPANWTVDDVANLRGARFVGRAGQQQAALVGEKTSFALSKVETSNALVLVPPPPPPSDDGGDDERPAKKLRAADGKEMTAMTARLMGGGSGASFLELRPKTLSLTDVKRSLVEWDPYNANHESNKQQQVQGRTATSLAADLQCSVHEMDLALPRIDAYAVPDTFPVEYCLLSEEAIQETAKAMVSALAEADGCEDYATEGVNLAHFVEQVLQRLEERFDGAESVARHCLQPWVRGGSIGRSATSVRLSVSKVARTVARGLFRRRAVWKEPEFFINWQAAMPGVGDRYQVKKDWLRGIAVVLENEEGDALFKYLPVERCPTDPAECFDVLFAAKETWSLEELEPYLSRLGSSPADLLLRFTTQVVEEHGGVSMKVHRKK
jgi:hypothetical protein